MDSFSIENLISYLDKKHFTINGIYSINNSCSFIRICTNNQEDIIISIPFKYPMRTDKSIELVRFTDTESDVAVKTRDNTYNQIESKGLEDDNLYLNPEEADKLLEQYQEIDIDQESTDILKTNIISYKKQLERLKKCTINIKYKLCIVSQSSFCTVTRLNDIECFAVKRGHPTNGEDKDLCIIIDLENFYDRVDVIHNDVSRLYRTIYDIMDTSHNKQLVIINSRLRQYNTLSENIKRHYSKRDKYEKTIESLNEVLSKIKKQEIDIDKKIKVISGESDMSINATSYKSFSIKKLDEDRNKLLVFKDNSLKLLSEIKTEYNNFLLDFDSAMSDCIQLFNQMSSNFIKIGVLAS